MQRTGDSDGRVTLVAVEPPLDRDLALFEGGERLEGATAQVDLVLRAGGALVSDGGGLLLAAVLDGDLLTAVLTGHGRGDGDHLVVVTVVLAARAGTAALAVPGGLAVTSTLAGGSAGGQSANEDGSEGSGGKLHDEEVIKRERGGREGLEMSNETIDGFEGGSKSDRVHSPSYTFSRPLHNTYGTK